MNKGPLVFVALAIAALIVAAFAILLVDKLGLGTADPLPVERFQSTPANFVGNQYSLTGRIDRQIGYNERVGRLITVRTTDGNHPVSVFVPAGFGGNIEVGAQYRLSLNVRNIRNMTILEVTDLRKL